MNQKETAKKPICTGAALLIAGFGVVAGSLLYFEGRGSGFEGWGAMVFGTLLPMVTLPIALVLGLCGLIRRERFGGR